MDLNDLLGSAADQDKGHEFELLDPVEGEPTGFKFTIAGPDSERAKAAGTKLEAAVSRHGARKARIAPDVREKLMIDFLFEVTIGWDVKQGGKPLDFTRENFGRLLGAGTWVRAQLDTFASDRAPYFRAGA